MGKFDLLVDIFFDLLLFIDTIDDDLDLLMTFLCVFILFFGFNGFLLYNDVFLRSFGLTN